MLSQESLPLGISCESSQGAQRARLDTEAMVSLQPVFPVLPTGGLLCSLGRCECDAVLDAVREYVAPLALAAAEHAGRCVGTVGAVGACLMADTHLGSAPVQYADGCERVNLTVVTPLGWRAPAGASAGKHETLRSRHQHQ